VSVASGERTSIGRRLTTAAIAVATALVITGATIALFFNPVWVSFAQGRANAAAYTGWTPAQVAAVTRAVVLEVWLGPGEFAQEVAGEPVFDARERAHMADVRRVVLAFYVVVLAAVATLVVVAAASRGSRWFAGAVALGAGGLAIGAVAVGSAFALFFDRAFTLFHAIFFAQGTWTFDPATDRLVQLLPYQFWTETTVAVALAGLLLTVAVWAVARRAASPPARRAQAAPSASPAGEGEAR
jgi:integral membrane protein (TIGR01906 family)